MNLVGVFIVQVAKLLHMLLNAYMWIVIISSLLSWVRPDPYHPIVRFLSQLTEPLYRLIRNRLPRSWLSTGLDFSPMIVLFAILFVDTVLITLLVQLGYNLQDSGLLLPQPGQTAPLPQIP